MNLENIHNKICYCYEQVLANTLDNICGMQIDI